ncbi:Na/Pi-cotransporter II-like protein [Prevotella amnii]|uniref:Na/Pi-cotransporter II-like protein n=1 Tax=Prevotella amnii TaxID=419005 RepID=A0A134BKC4_9BACT|nr:Na/Pi cotransporter family protein [Prevotella amnii]KXB80400.1 Na/Pi-cotransporter II-like protein [Prevotella amnii]
MNTNDYIIITIKLLGALALLIYGMKVMSEALQKLAGSQLRHILGAMTTNRFTGMLTGTFVTAAVQSSTATTVMTVSFVNAGLLTLSQSISVIMGANIGTTLTAWIMSVGFKINLEIAVFVAFFIGIILIYNKKRRYIGDLLFGLAFLFFAVVLLSQAGNELDLSHNPAAVHFFSSFDPTNHFNIVMFLLIGSLITCMIHSSAAVMAITLLLCSTGVLPIYFGVALVMGENIGTTITANLAALAANTQARRAAFAHFMFNLIGVIWIMCIFYPFVDFVCNLVGYDTHAKNLTQEQIAKLLPIALAMFHTCFNICNTSILIWFIPQFEKIVCMLVKNKTNKEDDEFRLRFIQVGIMKTPELSVLEASKEIQSFSERIHRMFCMVRELINTHEEEPFTKLFNRIEKYESISDNMEVEIAKYLDQVSDSHLSDDTKEKVRDMLREISEIESIGDSCYNLARTIKRKRGYKNEHFTEDQYNNIEQMFKLTDEALSQMDKVLIKRNNDYLNRSFTIENEINKFRNQLRDQNINDINTRKYTYVIGTMYMDLIQECEKLGDYIINVVEARMHVKQEL